MIRAAFNLSTIPFTKNIEAKNLFQHAQFTTMQKRLAMLFENRGIGMFTGDVGCGKSTAIRAVLDSVSSQTHKTVYLYRGLEELGTFYKQIALQLGIMPMFRKSDIARQVIATVEELYTQQKITTVLVIDEAHLLSAEVLDEIRLIHNSHYDSTDYLATALVGQTPLKKMMNYNKFLPLKQRLSITCHIKALSKNDAYKYVEHQVALSKAANKIFMDNALETIITASKGVPRVINTLALKAMNKAVEMKLETVDQKCVIDALDEIGMSLN